jgi:ketosteroid isomerase-like protein
MTGLSAKDMCDVVRRAYDAFNHRDVDAFCALATDDVEFHDLPEMPDPEVFRGRKGVETFFRANWDVFERVWGELDDVLDAGPNRVVALARHGGQARGGPPLEQSRGLLITFSDDGKMREVRMFGDQATARAAAGLDEHSVA